MDCSADEQLVRIQLADLGGVQRVAIDLDARHVVVDHQRPASDIAQALDQLGLGSCHVDDDGDLGPDPDTSRERFALVFAFAINAAFFVGELAAGLISASMGLVADALDMGADASVYGVSLFAVGTTAARKRRLARASGYLQLTLATVGLVEVVRRAVFDSDLPDPTSMIAVSLLALAGNVAVLVVLHRARSGEAHLEASWIFTANDVKVNALVIAAAVAVALTDSVLPDLVAGGIIFVVVANGARRILNISR